MPFKRTVTSDTEVTVDRSALVPKPVPVMVTVVPPADVPLVGEMAVTVGVMLVVYVKEAANVAVGPPSVCPSPRTCRIATEWISKSFKNTQASHSGTEPGNTVYPAKQQDWQHTWTDASHA